MLRDIGSAAAAYALRLGRRGPAELRDWHAVRMTDHLGEREGRARLFSFAEVVEIGVGVSLIQFGLKHAPAFAIARKHGHQIRAALPPNEGEPIIMVAFNGRPDEQAHGSIMSGRVGELEPSARVILAINIPAVAADIEARLREYLAVT